MSRKRKAVRRTSYPIISWRPDRRATRGHIREAIRLATDDLMQSATLLADRAAYDRQCGYMQQHANQTFGRGLRDVARQHLEYWRMRAFMPGAYGMANMGDRPAHAKWMEFSQ
jgi:hypothetical protein